MPHCSAGSIDFAPARAPPDFRAHAYVVMVRDRARERVRAGLKKTPPTFKRERFLDFTYGGRQYMTRSFFRYTRSGGRIFRSFFKVRDAVRGGLRNAYHLWGYDNCDNHEGKRHRIANWPRTSDFDWALSFQEEIFFN